jgi:hypothetical protein
MNSDKAEKAGAAVSNVGQGCTQVGCALTLLFGIIALVAALIFSRC